MAQVGSVQAPASTGLVRVAACQVSIRIGQPDRNRRQARHAIAAAAAAGAQVVVLPELTTSGYVFRDAAEARSLAEPADGPTISDWCALAAEAGLVIIGGFCEQTAGAVYNSAAIVDAAGLRGVYRKAHLWDAEPDCFTPGSADPVVVDTAHGRVGVLICYDAEFPEWVRRPALAGAELLAVPTNWPAEPVPPGERPNVVVNIQAAAFTNRMFVAAACRCTPERGVRWTGGTLIAGPDGYPLAGPTAGNGPALIVADCALPRARAKANGPRNDVHADRRLDLYG